MPNWVEQQVTIKSDDAKKIADILNTVRSLDDEGNEVFNLAMKIAPMPEEIANVFGTGDDTKWIIDIETNEKIDISLDDWFANKDKTDQERGWRVVEITNKEREKLREKYGASDWYAWNNRNYGTKWGDCRTQLIKNEPNEICFDYDSAWSPAIPISALIVEKFEVDVIHRFYSIENMDEGKYVFKNGHLVESWWKELDHSVFMDEQDDKKK